MWFYYFIIFIRKGIIVIEIMNLRTDKPSELWDVKVDRSSPLGNPFFMKTENRREQVCDKYETWFEEQFTKYTQEERMEFNVEIGRLERLHARHGKLRLFCWCAPKRCHAETIRDYLEGLEL